MKHLVYFNESKESKQSKILNDFCLDYLAYLLDYGFKINIVTRNHNPSDPSSFNSTLSDSEYRISIKNSYASFGTRNKKFTWESVKDEIVPFIEILNEKYKVNNIKFVTPKELDKYINNTLEYEDIIDDEFSFSKEIVKIEIVVEEK